MYSSPNNSNKKGLSFLMPFDSVTKCHDLGQSGGFFRDSPSNDSSKSLGYCSQFHLEYPHDESQEFLGSHSNAT